MTHMGIAWVKNNSGYISEGLEWRFSTANAAEGIIEERLEKKCVQV